MHLAAVVDVVLEEVREHAVERLALDAGPARDRDLGTEARVVEAHAQVDQPAVGGALLDGELAATLERLLGPEMALGIRVGCHAGEAALERLEVVPVHRQDVVQGRLDRREEARARRGELLRREQRAGFEQAVVRPRVVVGLGGEVAGERRGSGHPI